MEELTMNRIGAMQKFVGLTALAALFALAGVATAQQTPAPTVAAYSSLADAILALKRTEHDFVASLLDVHYQVAQADFAANSYGAAAAQMALFANEGDNAVAGVRKRLLEGGHHHNASGEAQGVYEPGYVIVTIEAKEALLAASASMRQATNEAQARDAWNAFEVVAAPLLGT